LPELDAALGGGFVVAAVHELVAVEEGVAAWSLALRTAARAAGSHKWVFYIDSHQELYPPGVVQLGVPLGRLLVIRVSWSVDALWVCEQSLRCRAVAAVVLPLRTIDAYRFVAKGDRYRERPTQRSREGPPARSRSPFSTDTYVSRRLQLAAEAGGSLGLLIRRGRCEGHTFAASRLRLEPLVGPAGVRRIQVTVLKLREGRPCAPFVVEWPDAADSVPAPAVPVDGAGVARQCIGG
jgi:protein ImuA